MFKILANTHDKLQNADKNKDIGFCLYKKKMNNI